MSNTTGDPSSYSYRASYWCSYCNAFHCYPDNYYYPHQGYQFTASFSINRDQEIIDLLEQILVVLKEIRNA